MYLYKYVTFLVPQLKSFFPMFSWVYITVLPRKDIKKVLWQFQKKPSLFLHIIIFSQQPNTAVH